MDAAIGGDQTKHLFALCRRWESIYQTRPPPLSAPAATPPLGKYSRAGFTCCPLELHEELTKDGAPAWEQSGELANEVWREHH